MPPDFAIASDDKLVDSSIVTAGGVMTAKRPHLARKARRSVAASTGPGSAGCLSMVVVLAAIWVLKIKATIRR